MLLIPGPTRKELGTTLVQFLHTLCPWELNRPAGQSMHVEFPAAEYVAGWQATHRVALVLLLKVPAEHRVHLLEPIALLKEPVVQTAQSTPGRAYWPAGHPQTPAPALLNLPVGHAVHSVAPELLYVPLRQLAHTPAPLESLNVPAAHEVQLPERAMLYFPELQIVHSVAVLAAL